MPLKKYKGLDCILLVDDDTPTNFIHTRIVSKASIDVAVKAVTSAEEALELITCSGRYINAQDILKPGIIFLDINMPGLNGWDFMEAYHALDEQYKAMVIVIMLTTSLNPDDRERALLDRDIVTFISKPLKPEIVAELVEKYFEAVNQ